MKHKPWIGIAPNIFELPAKPQIFGIYDRYAVPLREAGAVPVILAPDPGLVRHYVRDLDGLLLTGGGDIHPKFFGGTLPRVKLHLTPDLRTRFDLAVARAFLKAGKPVLGICLGCQTLNVALGGTLIQDLATERPGTRDHRKGMHTVRVIAGTRLRKVLGKDDARVTTRHHQAIGEPGRGLKISAMSADDVIEAVEWTGDSFVLGIQWHPEVNATSPESRALFSAFVRAGDGGDFSKTKRG